MFKYTSYSFKQYKLVWGFVFDGGRDFKFLEETLSHEFQALNLQYAYSKQNHTNHVTDVIESIRLENNDGFITDKTNIVLTVYTADCLPIIMLEESTPLCCIVHAGWQGIRNEILKSALQKIKEKTQNEDLSLKIAILPYIHPLEYEVGKEFKKYFHQESFIEQDGSLYFDMVNEIKIQLRSEQVFVSELPYPENMEHFSSISTYKNLDYPSYRRDNSMNGRIVNFCFLVKE